MPPVAERSEIRESGRAPIREAYGVTGSRREITIITEGWGSSGYYSAEVLRRDGPTVFPVGTKMYIDHPTPVEERERPERSVRDLAAVITQKPFMAGSDLVAECELKPNWEDTINALAEDIGLSIRAFGEAEYGAAGGKEGPIITSLLQGESVDFVTDAGRGGKIGKLIQESRTSVPLLEEAVWLGEHWKSDEAELREAEAVFDQFLGRELTAEARIALAEKGLAIPVRNSENKLIGGRFPMENAEDVRAAAMTAGRTKLPDVKTFISNVAEKLDCPAPFKEEPVLLGPVLSEARNAGHWFEARIHRDFTMVADSLFGEGHLTREERIGLSGAVGEALQAFGSYVEKEVPTLMSRDPYGDPGPTEQSVSENAPAPKNKRRESIPMDVEKELSELKEGFATFKTESEQRLSESEAKAKEANLRADRAEERLQVGEAAKVVAAVVEETKLPDKAKQRAIEAALTKGVPTDSEDRIDRGVLEERARAAVKDEADYIKEFTGTTESGGRVSNLGESVSDLFNQGGGGTDEAATTNLETVLAKLPGMKESTAKLAAAGRVRD